MRVIAEMWRGLDENSKKIYVAKSLEDKQRYEDELASYDGPLKVPNKRAKKDPDAPKRAMSAFLHFSQERRPVLKAQFPEEKNIEISKKLGLEWGCLSAEQRAPYQAKSDADAARYRADMKKWTA
ncbi:unnamed protein product, partial [Phaeothamnion confervicola]